MDEQPEARRAPRGWLAALFVMAAAYGYVLVGHSSRSVGGSDSSGYFNSARSLARGRAVEPVDALDRLGLPAEDFRLCTPLGYVPGPRPGTMASFYPPGLPLHIAAVGSVAGWDQAPFWISPLFAVASVLLTYAVGRELGLAPASCLAAAAMLAVLPVLNFQAMQLMSDTAAAAWALAAVWCALRSRRHAGAGWAAAAGFACGVGVLVRPASAVLLAPLALALPWRPRTWLLFLAGGAPCAAFFGLYNRACYGSPFSTGYGAGGALADFALGNFPLRIRLYLYWISSMTTPVLPAAAALSLLDGVRPRRTRLLLLAWFGAFFLCYCFYGPSDAWWYTRYLLPGLPALYLAAAMGVEDALGWLRARESGRTTRPRLASRLAVSATVLAVLLLLGVCWTGLNLGRRYRVLRYGIGEAVYPETLRWLDGRLPPDAVVAVMQFSGAMRAYEGRTPTRMPMRMFVRWDYLEASSFPRIRRRLEERGYRIYALVFPFEVRDAAGRMPGKWTYLGSNRDAGLFRLEP